MKIYEDKKSGLTYLTGRIKEIVDGKLIVNTQEAVQVAKKDKDGNPMKNKDGFEIKQTQWVDKEVAVTSKLDFVEGDEYKKDRVVTVIGDYNKRKGTLEADEVISKAPAKYSYEFTNEAGVTEDVVILAGLVQFARENPELDKDGKPNVKKDGTPRKPHFDVGIRVKDADGKVVTHVVKYYDSVIKGKDGQDRQIKNMTACKERFANYDREKNTPFVTIKTDRGNDYVLNRQTENGEKSFFYCDHINATLPDVELVNYVANKNRNNTQQAQATQEQPTQSSGFEQDSTPDYDEMDEFN